MGICGRNSVVSQVGPFVHEGIVKNDHVYEAKMLIYVLGDDDEQVSN